MIDADDLPEGWVLATLGDVTAPKVKQGEPRPDADFTYIDIGSVDNQSKRITDPKVTPGAKAPSRARQLVEPGDVLVSMTRPNLNAVAVVPPELAGSVASTGFHVLRPAGVASEWLFAVVRSTAFIQAMSELVQGALYPAVRPDDIRSFIFPLPPLAEQRRIVARIEALQARSRTAREALNAVPGLLEQLRQSVLAAAFRGDLTADWREQHPDAEPAEVLLDRIRQERRRQWESKNPRKKYVEPERLDDADLPELPIGWCWARTEEVCGFITKGTTPPADRMSGSGEVPFIKVYNLTLDGVLNFSKEPTFIDKATHSEGPLARSRIFPGDVLMNLVGPPLGKVSIVPDSYPEWNCNQAIAIYRPVGGLLADYLCMALLHTDFIHLTVRQSKATAGQHNLTLEIARDFRFPLAPLAEQREILDRIKAAWAMSRVTEGDVARTALDIDRLEHSLLRKAFCGELVEQDPGDESASALLERIRSGSRQPSAPTTPLRVEDVVHDLILLLEAVGGPMDRAALELGLVLMRNDRARTAILDKTARVPRGPAAGRTHVAGLDHLLGDLQRLKGWVTIAAGPPQTVALTDRTPATDGATADDRRRVQETLKVMATVKKDRLAAAVEKVSDVAYELVPGR